MPVKRKGRITTREPGFPLKDLKKILAAINATMNNTPPITSHFQAIINTPINIKTGMLCIRKPSSFLVNGSFPPKTSSENIPMNRIARIVKIRGIQYKNF